MTAWPAKDPDETVIYTDDWAAQLGADTIASYIVTPTGTATVAKQQQLSQALKFWISGGTDETTTTFAIRVTTTGGQILDREYSVYVASGESAFLPTTTTKRALVEQMYLECKLNDWEYDIDPEELDKALTRLDMLMWDLKGRVGDLVYNFPTGIGRGSLNDELGCPDQAFAGLAILGAQRLCPTMGKSMSAESRTALSEAMKSVRACTSLAPNMAMRPNTPRGSGNRLWSWPYNNWTA